MPPLRVRVPAAVFAFALWAIAATASAAVPWDFGASAFVFLPPDDDKFVSPILDADRGALHLEARYNYEDLETGSAFVGRNIPFKDEGVRGTVVPVFGLVLGNTAGIAPGVNIDLSWGRFALADQTELVIELPDFDQSFLYSWIEATLEPIHGLRIGLAAQRTKLSETAWRSGAGRCSRWRRHAGGWEPIGSTRANRGRRRLCSRGVSRSRGAPIGTSRFEWAEL
jgi:hypothetical protein